LHSFYASTIQESHKKKPTKKHLFTTTLHLHHDSKHVTKEDIIFSKQQKLNQVKEFQHGVMDNLTTTIMNITLLTFTLTSLPLSSKAKQQI
jgi:hypothetical protein